MAPPPPVPASSSASPPPLHPPNNNNSLPPLLRLPLIVSESLRSSLLPPPPHHDSSSSSPQGVVSILLSSSDLAKLDLSKLELFSIHGTLDMLSSSSSASLTALSSSASAPHSATSIVDSTTSTTHLVEGSPDDPSFYNHTSTTPLVLSPAVVGLQQLSDDVPVSILKSKAVVEAEKACVEQEMVRRGAISPSPRGRRKALSMDEIAVEQPMWINERVIRGEEGQKGGMVVMESWGVMREQQNQEQIVRKVEEEKVQRVGDDDDAKKKKKKTVTTKAEEEEEEEAVARIDLRASPAAKFLVQVMPWELTPPITPATTPAAVPFLWEVVPGQPKPKPNRLLPSPCASLPLPPRLLLLQPPPLPPSSSSAVISKKPSSSSSSSIAAATSSDPPPPATAIGPPSSSISASLTPSTTDLSSPIPSSPTSAADAPPSAPPIVSLQALHSTREVPPPSLPAPHGGRHRKNTHSWHVLQNLRLHLHGHTTDSASHRHTSSPQREKAIADESATPWSDEYHSKEEEETKNQRSILKPTTADALPVTKLSRTNSLVRLLSKVKQKSRVLSWKSAYLQRGGFRKIERDDQIGPFPSS